MYFLYIFALAPVLLGLFLWYKDKEISLKEYLLGSAISFVTAIIFNLIALGCIHAKIHDTECWSGYVVKVEHLTKWVEQWEEMHVETYPCGTDDKGNTEYCTRTYYTTEYDTHPERWIAYRYFGEYQDSIDINYDVYCEIKNYFGNKIVIECCQPYNHGGKFYSGDNKIYSTYNDTQFIYPATIKKSFKNRIKATPNIFQFAKIPTNVLVYNWPESSMWNKSDRLMGAAQKYINLLKFDQLNAILGPNKRVNIIMIGFDSTKDQIYGQYQQAKFIGGKKNDLVITFGGGNKNKPADWAYVYGWSEKELVKRNIETILLNNPINDNLLLLIEKEINQNYVKKDWHKFDYISVSPPMWVYLTYIILTIIIQISLYIWFHNEEVFNDILTIKDGFGYGRIFRY